MENSTPVNFKERLKRLITYQDVLSKNNLLAQRTCDQGLLFLYILRSNFINNHIRTIENVSNNQIVNFFIE
jgi:hypothetical protein